MRRLKIPPFTIMVIPHSGRRTRSLFVPPLITALAAVFGLAVTISAVTILKDYHSVKRSAGQIEELQAVVDTQAQTISSLREQASDLETQIDGIDTLRKEVTSFLTEQAVVDAGLTKYLSPQSQGLLKKGMGQTYRGSYQRPGDKPMGGAAEPALLIAEDTQRLFSHLDTKAQDLHEQIELTIAAMNEALAYLRSCPTTWPMRGEITSRFGYRRSPFTGLREFHEGLDIAASTGTEVVSAADGRVAFAGWQAGFGKMVKVDHGHGFSTVYAHLYSTKVKVGEHVERSQKVGLSGNSGSSTGPHLHFAVLVNGTPVDPEKYLTLRNGAVSTAARQP